MMKCCPSLRKKVQDDLNQMEAMGTITKVTEPTFWYVGMVVVPKRSGDVTICMDDIIIYGPSQEEHNS